MAEHSTIAAAILTMVEERGPDKSICPSEAARRLAGASLGWRTLMPLVHAVSLELAREGRVRLLQNGREANLATLKGPYRLARI